MAPSMLTFPDRTLEQWSVDAAVAEAERDIKNESVKVYLSGTIAAYPPGIPPEEYELIRGLPMADAGMGCLIEDGVLRAAQYAYAEAYNKRVIEHLRKNSSFMEDAGAR